MTDAEKVAMVKTMSGETDDRVISAYLLMAAHKILRIAYPYDDTVSAVPAKYDGLQVDAAVYLLNKRGAEGENVHNENGINRAYESADLPPSMLRVIVPMAGVPKNESTNS